MKFPDDYLNKVICGDCLEIMNGIPDKSVDLVLTDPPYGSDFDYYTGRVNMRSHLADSIDYGKENWNKWRPSAEYFNEAIRISKNQIIFGGNFFTDVLPPSSSWIVWDKENGDLSFGDCELAWTNHKTSIRKIAWRWQGMLQGDMKNKEIRVHPTQKPLAVMKWIIDNYSIESDLILDPFFGSGTTGVAAKLLGRQFIGIEISEKYCEIARKRIGTTPVNKKLEFK